MEALLIGDSHGNLAHVRATLHIAKEHDYDVAIHVGDFGWWPTSDKNSFVMICDQMAKELDLPFWVIDGNHDFPGNDHHDQRGYRFWAFDEDMRPLYAPGLKWIPRATLMELDGHKVMFMGGAASVDRKFRIDHIDWWPDELITDKNVEAALTHGKIDVIISHDRFGIPSFFRKLNFGEQVEAMLVDQRSKWSEIFDSARPQLHIHGHFHVKYDIQDDEWPHCRTVGLAHENMESFCGLNFETLEITWPELTPADNAKFGRKR